MPAFHGELQQGGAFTLRVKARSS